MKTKQVVSAARPHSATAGPAIGLALLTAATALMAAKNAHADLAPERGMISLKYLDYQDSQSGQDRIGVHAPSIMVMAPVAGVWSVSGTFTSDVVSGASPAFHTEQLTKMKDHRKAVDLSVTRYFPRGSLTLGASHSQESDYISRGLSAQGTISTEDKNTTFNLGVGTSDDTITPSYGGVHEKKNVTDVMVGVTQVLTKQDIAQLNYGFSHGRGYFSDPYKLADERPRERNHRTILARWNHHFAFTDGTSHLSYRYYWDTWDIRAHTISGEYVQPLPYGWTLTPGVRFYTQTAARFYLPVDPANPSWPTFPSVNATEFSEDQRLSAFGAVTVGLKVAKQLSPDWLLDVKFEKYKQRSDWAWSGTGDPGLAPFDARTFQFGITRYF
ncbi:DUF3570 domain-containing protein [Novimethylophilus kurashikiensis]|nr:DUF3570 domain-containing protein [Novimethylophilus kurashikiensis]